MTSLTSTERYSSASTAAEATARWWRRNRHHIIRHCEARKSRSCSGVRASMERGSNGSVET